MMTRAVRWRVLALCSLQLLVSLDHGARAQRIGHQLGRLVSESACERKDPGSNPAADMVDAARNTAWDLGVATFTQPDGMTKDSVLRYKGPDLPAMSEMSVCVRVRILQPRQFASLLSYSVADYDNELVVGLGPSSLDFMCCHSLVWLSIPMSFHLFQWFSTCVSLDLIDGNVTVVMDGDVVFHGTSYWQNYSSLQILGGGILVLGQEQDNYGGLFDIFESFKGSLADLHLFKEALNREMLIEWTKNFTKISTPAVVSFQNFDLFSVGEVDLKYETNQEVFSEVVVPFFKVFSVFLSYTESVLLCKATGGSLPNVYSRDENHELFLFLSALDGVCNIENAVFDVVWLNHVVDKNGIVRDHPGGRKSTFSYFLQKPVEKSQLRGCISFYSCGKKSLLWHERWSSTNCDFQRQPVCAYQRFPYLRLRGLCSSSRFDQKYFIEEVPMNPNLVGMFLSRIDRFLLNNTNSQYFFKLYNVAGLKTEAHLNLSITYPLPIGRHEWTILADNCKTGKVALVLTSCDEHEFTCNDGSCIDRRRRCDFVIHCSDGSDEHTCDILKVPPVGYYPMLPPPEPIGQKLRIESLINIDRIFGINLDQSTLKCDLLFTMSWRDSAISFRNLKWNPNENVINEDNSNSVWMPDYELYGDDFSISRKQTRSKKLLVVRRSKPEADDPSSLASDYIYLGKKNALVLKHLITVTTTCKLQLNQFPFDVQRCLLYIGLRRLDGHTVFKDNSGAHLIDFSGINLSLHYVVKNFSASIEITKNAAEELVRVIKVIIVLKNRFVFYVVNVYVPSLIMLLIGYLSFFFPLHDFNDRVMVSLTALLVETTFFTQVSDYAPRTSFLKKIDVWCIFCIVLLFGIIVAVTIINIFMEKLSTKKSRHEQYSLEKRNSKDQTAQMITAPAKQVRTVQVKPYINNENNDFPEKLSVAPQAENSTTTFPAFVPSSNYLAMPSFRNLKKVGLKKDKKYLALKINKCCLYAFPSIVCLFLVLYSWQIVSYEDYAFITSVIPSTSPATTGKGSLLLELSSVLNYNSLIILPTRQDIIACLYKQLPQTSGLSIQGGAVCKVVLQQHRNLFNGECYHSVF
ncbi:Pentraxin-related [Trinorchestia longiramus]|nr:Pentraxin-related [Trinorchestia longiramus]